MLLLTKRIYQRKIDLEEVKQLAGEKRIVTTSLLKEEGIDELEEAIASLFFEGHIEAVGYNVCI